jgi:hypothetical protein
MDFSVFEALMLICFGVSWPFSIARSVKARSAKGKSIAYLVLLDLAYVSGILHKALVSLDIVLGLYILNFAMVSIDIALYIRNARLDKLQAE